MKPNISCACRPGRILLLAAAVLVVASAIAKAETYVGMFSLPMEVHWRDLVLAPGDYTFKLDTGGPLQRVTIEGKQGRQYVYPSGWSDQKFGGRSALIVLRNGGGAFVQELQIELKTLHADSKSASPRVYGSVSGNIGNGLIFTFKPPKGEKILAMNEPGLIQRIPITLIGM